MARERERKEIRTSRACVGEDHRDRSSVVHWGRSLWRGWCWRRRVEPAAALQEPAAHNARQVVLKVSLSPSLSFSLPLPFFCSTTTLLLPPVWPDGSIERSPISSKVAKNVDAIDFTLKVMLLKMPKQFSKYLGNFWNKNFCPRTLKNRPIWSRWPPSQPEERGRGAVLSQWAGLISLIRHLLANLKKRFWQHSVRPFVPRLKSWKDCLSKNKLRPRFVLEDRNNNFTIFSLIKSFGKSFVVRKCGSLLRSDNCS